MAGIEVLVGLTSALAVFGAAELAVHRRRLRAIPIRVHVNGTRGKSSVTRLIAAGLREGGIRTCAKTTGTLARMILPDGKELPIYRPAGANIIEQRRIVALAADQRAEALVVECMALQPALQSLCELKLIESTHGVVTNARPDHLDVMGPEARDVALALAGTTPVKGKLFLADEDHRDVFERAARDRGSDLVVSEACDEASTLARFRYTEHPSNVGVALAVCETLGVDRDVALEGMWKGRPDPRGDDRAPGRVLRAPDHLRQRLRCQRPGVDAADLEDGGHASRRGRAAHRGVQLPRGSTGALALARAGSRRVAPSRPRGADGNGHLPLRPRRDQGWRRPGPVHLRRGARGGRRVRAHRRSHRRVGARDGARERRGGGLALAARFDNRALPQDEGGLA